MRKDLQERWCLSQLESAVRRRYPGADLSHHKGTEPPDFWLRVNDRRFAVEITTIRLQEELTDWQSLRRLTGDIESQGIRAQELSGRYVIQACAKLPPGRKARKELRLKVREYLRVTETTSTALPRELTACNRRFGQISKYAPDGARLHLVGGLSDTGAGEDEIRPELQTLLNQRIANKRGKLVRCQVPVILVLYDCYGLEAEVAGFVESIRESPDILFFRAVLLVHSGGDAVFAHLPEPLTG